MFNWCQVNRNYRQDVSLYVNNLHYRFYSKTYCRPFSNIILGNSTLSILLYHIIILLYCISRWHLPGAVTCLSGRRVNQPDFSSLCSLKYSVLCQLESFQVSRSLQSPSNKQTSLQVAAGTLML